MMVSRKLLCCVQHVHIQKHRPDRLQSVQVSRPVLLRTFGRSLRGCAKIHVGVLIGTVVNRGQRIESSAVA